MTTATVRFSPYDYEVHEDPYPLYARLRAEAPPISAAWPAGSACPPWQRTDMAGLPEPLLLVGGHLRGASDDGTFPVENPATGEQIALAPDATDADVHEAITAARRAFDQTAWGTDPGCARVAYASSGPRSMPTSRPCGRSPSPRRGCRVPARIEFVPEVLRSPGGKADYRWARSVLT
jgi:Aldehyde dehydrogenase family